MRGLLNLDRRGFFKAAAGAGVATAMGGVLAGCAPQPKSAASATDELAATGTSWLGEAPVIDESEITQTIEADIIVVGGGNAGTMCACAAAENGATVAVIEAQAKADIFYYGLHDIASINSQYVLDSGLEPIKKGEFLAEYQRRTHNKTNPRLVKKFIDASGEMVDWLVGKAPQEVLDKAHVAHFTTNSEYFKLGSSLNGFKCWPGYVQIDFQTTAPALIAEAEASGATWYWEHSGVVLETSTEEVAVQKETVDPSGAVTFIDATEPRTTVNAVIAQDAEGNYLRFVGTKGIVLTCGDYGGNPEMYAALQDEQRWLFESHGLDAEDLHCMGFGRDGSGIKMGLWAGATLDPGPRCLVSPQVMYESTDFATNVLRWGSGFNAAAAEVAAGAGGASQNPWGTPFVCVDGSGKRFTDETFLGIFGTLSQVERRKPGRYYFFFDNKWKETMARMAPEHFSQPVGVPDSISYDDLFNSWVERGAKGAPTEEGGTVCAWAANSLDELFDYMGLDEAMRPTVAEEIARYNSFCETGEDEDFGRDANLLQSITEPPFFGMYSVFEKPMTGTVTLNGLVIDDDQRVLDANYNPIEGLYASGNNSGGRFAVQYSTPMSGLTLGFAMTLGRELGKGLATGTI
ncbi:FAD-binding protein [Adlercreutzia sp. R21]|uniref:FAD-binding protein n=1 Tax=Adlercreutzia wanghongyangiae TaxID=3111451 RepID=A0ABU6IG96_9ACTN|nr:FAD-binding protein [Adlercreutzia sp. R21]MEC4175467.1 FAD-binding protein [Adlercreutzia sp. R7]MEC4183320.1 FAD-binding protein [Adlercreutzia sp. R21]